MLKVTLPKEDVLKKNPNIPTKEEIRAMKEEYAREMFPNFEDFSPELQERMIDDMVINAVPLGDKSAFHVRYSANLEGGDEFLEQYELITDKPISPKNIVEYDVKGQKEKGLRRVKGKPFKYGSPDDEDFYAKKVLQ